MEENQYEPGWHPVYETKTVEINPPLDPDSSDSVEKYEISTSKEFGSFELFLTIPEDATFRQYRIEIKNTLGGGDSFTVGDPRPPTVSLTVDAPRWVSRLVPVLYPVSSVYE